MFNHTRSGDTHHLMAKDNGIRQPISRVIPDRVVSRVTGADVTHWPALPCTDTGWCVVWRLHLSRWGASPILPGWECAYPPYPGEKSAVVLAWPLSTCVS